MPAPLRELNKRGAPGSEETGSGKQSKKIRSASEKDDDEWARIERAQALKVGGGGADLGKKGNKDKKGKKGKKGKKPQKSEDHDDNSSSDDSDDDDNDLEGGGMSLEGNDGQIENFTFEFRDMLESFEEGITTLMKQLIANPTEAYNVAHIIAKQDIVGTSVMCEGGDDIFAFTTVLPYSTLKDTCIPKLLGPIRSHNGSKKIDFLPELQTLLQNDKLGVMFHRRFVNFPLQLLGPLHQNLEEDLAWARGSQTGGTAPAALADDDEDMLRFKALSHVLLFTRGMLESNNNKGASSSSNSSSSSSAGSSGGITNITGSNGVLFENFEDEIYCQHADLVLQLDGTTASTIPSNIIVALIPLESFPKIRKEIDKLSNFGN